MKIRPHTYISTTVLCVLVAIFVMEQERYFFWMHRLEGIKIATNADNPNALVDVRVAERISPNVVRLILTLHTDTTVEIMPVLRLKETAEDIIIEAITLSSAQSSVSRFQLVCGICPLGGDFVWFANWTSIDNGEMTPVHRLPDHNGIKSQVRLGTVDDDWLLTVSDGAMIADARTHAILLGESEAGTLFELQTTRKR